MLLSANIARSAILLASLVPAVRSATFDVSVGGLGSAVLKYDPEFVNAAVGDEIRFIFKQKNHTATQSTFANPCVQVPGGFDSGYFPVAPEETDFEVAVLPVVSTDPVWVFCAQGNHCQNGMIFAVNPGERFDAFKAAATGGAAPPPAASSGGSPSVTLGAPTPSASSTGTNYKVLVGDGGSLAFEPSNIQAQPGDTITFEFRSKNHTVTASTFEQPCVPLPGDNTWDSGYIPVPAGATAFDNFQYTIRVNNTQPIWAYCKQGAHCGNGMVFSVNAVENSDKSFTAFQDLARTINGTGAPAGGAGNDPYGGNAFTTRASLTGAATAVVALLISTLVL